MMIEVNSDTRKILLHNKVKLAWTLCKADDNLAAKNASDVVDPITHIKSAKGRGISFVQGSHKQKECKEQLQNTNALIAFI